MPPAGGVPPAPAEGPTIGGACAAVVVVVTAWVVVVVVVVVEVGGVVVVVGVPLDGGGSGTCELDVGVPVVGVADDVVSVDDVGDVGGCDGEVEPLVSDDVADVVVDVSEPGAITTGGSGIGGGGAPGGRVALASFASTLTVSSCHCVTNSCFCSTSLTVATVVVTACNLSWAACH